LAVSIATPFVTGNSWVVARAGKIFSAARFQEQEDRYIKNLHVNKHEFLTKLSTACEKKLSSEESHSITPDLTPPRRLLDMFSQDQRDEDDQLMWNTCTNPWGGPLPGDARNIFFGLSAVVVMIVIPVIRDMALGFLGSYFVFSIGLVGIRRYLTWVTAPAASRSGH